MRKITFEYSAFEDFTYWSRSDKRIYKKIIDLIKNILRKPFSGIGKPEPLKNALSGYWSRRITKEHRLVYKVLENEIIIISCRYHYDI